LLEWFSYLQRTCSRKGHDFHKDGPRPLEDTAAPKPDWWSSIAWPADGTVQSDPCLLVGRIPVSVFPQSPSGSLPKRVLFHKTTLMHYLAFLTPRPCNAMKMCTCRGQKQRHFSSAIFRSSDCGKIYAPLYSSRVALTHKAILCNLVGNGTRVAHNLTQSIQ
jgi:hypothetical protein